MRDVAAALQVSATVKYVEFAFGLSKSVADCEYVMKRAVELGAGLLGESDLTKYTSVIEARMRLLGADIDPNITPDQVAAERTKTVAPGTRADIFYGYKQLSKNAEQTADNLINLINKILKSVNGGKSVTVVGVDALEYLSRCIADYGVACRKLCGEESACLVRRTSEFENYRRCLCLAAEVNGVATANASCDSLAAMAGSGLIPNVPPALYDVLLRYEKLPAVLSGESTNGGVFSAAYN